MNQEIQALTDALTETKDAQKGFENIALCLVELAKEINKVEKWKPAILALKRAEVSSRRAIAALAQLLPAND